MDVKTDAAPALRRLPTDASTARAVLLPVLSSLSHELNRPLTSLRAGFDLLLGDTERPIAPEQRRHVLAMVAICEELRRMTRSYLDFAGLMQGSRPLCCGSFPLGALIRDIDRQYAPTAAARQLGWGCSLEGEDGPVVTDASRCQQIFGNLVDNALKYTPAGGRVEVLARLEGREWSLSVRDTGLGIPVEVQERVFEPFFRLPRDEHSKVEGNGLGLAICREMVEQQMGGTIALDSAPERGTRVTVRFPSAIAGGPRPARPLAV